MNRSRGDDDYLRFCSKQNIDRQLHELDGMLRGLLLDGRIDEQERPVVEGWVAALGDLRDQAPFKTVCDALVAFLEDEEPTEEQLADLVWLCGRFTTPNVFYDAVTAQVQRLHGLLRGVLADDQLFDAEIEGLHTWLRDNRQLGGTYPYDDFRRLLSRVLEDGRVTEEERSTLRTFMENFLASNEHHVIEYGGVAADNLSLERVVVANVDVEFSGRKICFTGKSSRASRSEIHAIITELGGTPSPRVSAQLDFLVIGPSGNLCWAYSAYGRKIERALELRRRGAGPVIVHERDFWRAYDRA